MIPRLIKFGSIVGATIVAGAFFIMAWIATHYMSVSMPAVAGWWFIHAAQWTVFGIAWSFVMLLLGIWYDRVQSAKRSRERHCARVQAAHCYGPTSEDR